MARPLRIQYPSAVYHVMCRGNDRRGISGVTFSNVKTDAAPETHDSHFPLKWAVPIYPAADTLSS